MRKDNIEEDSDGDIYDADIARYSTTCWTVRALCFRRIFENYGVLQETWAESLTQGGMGVAIKARVVSCQTQMKTFDYFFGILLGQQLFSHNLSKHCKKGKCQW